jgi:hypothetical protein
MFDMRLIKFGIPFSPHNTKIVSTNLEDLTISMKHSRTTQSMEIFGKQLFIVAATCSPWIKSQRLEGFIIKMFVRCGIKVTIPIPTLRND